jgi:hypothetical protein
LRQRVPSTVQVPGQSERHKLDAADENVVQDGGDFVVGFLAECMLAQVLETDRASFMPGVASKLAVQAVDGEQEYVGSFDALVRIHASLGATKWRSWHKRKGALDAKLTGSSEPFGLNSPTVRRWLATGRIVLKAARKAKKTAERLCIRCIPRSSPTRSSLLVEERPHPRWVVCFMAFDVETLTSWDPKEPSPKPVLMLGDQIVGGPSARD